MRTYRYHNPVAATFGRNAIESLKQTVGNRNAVLVTFPEAEGLGITGRITDILGDRIIAVESGTEPNPDIVGLTTMYRRFWSEHRQCEVIVAVGGGSTLDTAKALMVGTTGGEFDELLASLVSGSTFAPPRTRPLIAVPTTAGTGSEVTPWATVWDRSVKMKKYSLHLKETWPEAAVVDPELTLSLPASVTLQSGLDALSHALESIWNVNANPVSDTFAVSAAREMMDTLPLLMADLRNVELRARASLAALKAGFAFSNTKTALAHSISYEMTLRHGLPHGIACSFTLPMVLGRAVGKHTDRDQVLSGVFPCSLDDAPAYLAQFLELLQVSTRFDSYGVSEPEAQKMIADALDGVRGRNFIGSQAA
ncbi:MAG TPA: iron-containing alcohol dehydrogenase PsrA [Burkholderiales bacterium]|nr:iron-containing alcohol dehydrogenase PsrA [Burkholderiales bacterium]